MYGAVTRCGRLFQNRSISKYVPMSQPYNPGLAETRSVWAVPVSLATTPGIIVILFSSGYLDVSVPRVRLPINRDIPINRDGLPHSAIRY